MAPWRLSWCCAAILILTVRGGTVEAVPDLTRPPDYSQMASLARSGGLSGFRSALGDALAVQWKPARNGRPGTCGEETFGKWVDLYQWLDLLESEESSVTKRWLSHHLSSTDEQTVGGEKIGVTIHVPGSPLVQRYDALQHRVTEQVAGDSSLLGQVMGKLVAPPFLPRNGRLIDRLDPEFVAFTLADPVFLARWSESFSEDDFAPKVLLNLQSIWKSNSAEFHDFLNLALALSVVMDQPFPDFWPHHQVPQRDVPRVELQPSESFARWVEAFRTGKLRTDLRQLAVKELKFVIDAPLAPSEFDFIRGSPSLSRLDPPHAFASIAYDRGRIAKDVYEWPWGAYLLSSIRNHGGICVDQAYYAAILGKAQGIPTIFFAGQGKDGGHAWLGYLKGRDSWDLNVGRYSAQNYATGEGLDPQNWTPITDHALDLLTRHLGNRDPQDFARRDLVMAWNFRRRNDAVAEGRALDSARMTCPENPRLWDAREDWLQRTASSAAEIKAHHESAIRQFSRFTDLRTQHEQALVRLARDTGDTATATRLSEQIVHENRGGLTGEGRADLSAAAAWNLINARMTARDLKGAVAEYERQLRFQGIGGGGDFFYRVVSPFASRLIADGRRDLALVSLKDAFVTMKPEKGSLVDRDLRKLWEKAGGLPPAE